MPSGSHPPFDATWQVLDDGLPLDALKVVSPPDGRAPHQGATIPHVTPPRSTVPQQATPQHPAAPPHAAAPPPAAPLPSPAPPPAAASSHVLFALDWACGDPSKAARPDYKGDDVNSWFVAVTRAQEAVHLPPKWWALADLAAAGEAVSDSQAKWWDTWDDGARRAAAELLDTLRGVLEPAREAAGSGEAGGLGEEACSHGVGGGEDGGRGEGEGGGTSASMSAADATALKRSRAEARLSEHFAAQRHDGGKKLMFGGT